MAERVIVTIDGGIASDAALEWAIHRAGSVPVQLELLTIAEIGWYPPGGAEVEYRTAYEEALLRANGRARDAGIKATKSLRFGAPAERIIAASEDADLLVIGSNKPGTLSGILHGTVPLRVAGRTRCISVIVPAAWTPGGSGVVVGWDDDGTADVALAFAAAEASRCGSRLTIVHTWQIPAALNTDAWAVVAKFEDIGEAHRQILAAAAARIREQYPSLQVIEKLETGLAAIAIVEAASSSELVVVGSHGRGTIGGLVLGSVSHDVLMNMPAPVAVVPDAELAPGR